MLSASAHFSVETWLSILNEKMKTSVRGLDNAGDMDILKVMLLY